MTSDFLTYGKHSTDKSLFLESVIRILVFPSEQHLTYQSSQKKFPNPAHSVLPLWSYTNLSSVAQCTVVGFKLVVNPIFVVALKFI